MVPYGCETSVLKAKGDYVLSAFENRMLRRIFGQKIDRRLGKTAQ
jgi:hypothetical protein